MDQRLNLGPRAARSRFRTRTDSDLNVAVVGLGYWGPNLLRVLFELNDVDVGYICDLDPDRLARFAKRYPSTRPTNDVDEILNDPYVDAVLIATPVFTH